MKDRDGWALAALLVLAAALRLWGVVHDLPFSYFGDELHFTKQAMALGTGDLNPHWFHKPALLMYALAFVYGLYFLAGRVVGEFGSTAEFGAHFLFAPGPFVLLGRLLVTLCGVATVWVVHRIGRRVYSAGAGLAAAAVAAVLTPMVISSQTIKSDVPCGLLMALSVLAFLGTRDDSRESPRLRPLALASLLAGFAMGAHYYAVVLVPAYLALEALRAFERRDPPRTALLRCALIPALFLAGFFLASPYNFLDPTWGRDTFGGLARTFGLSHEKVVAYDPDSNQEFEPGAAAFGGAAGAFLRLVASPAALGLPLSLLAAAGLAATLARRETRWYGLLVLVPCLAYFLAAITVAAYHAQPRHLNALFPLLATLIGPGAAALLRLARLPERRVPATTLALVALTCLPPLAASVRHDRRVDRLDSRTVAYHWIEENLPRDARLLLDDYGPLLNPDRRSAARQAALLASLPRGPFTAHQGTRLELLQRFPPRDGRDLDELGHPWWLPREKSDAELRRDPRDLDMGSPLVSRQPRPLEDYRRAGIRYVVTNSTARSQYFTTGPRGSRFPSFVRFYRELDGARRIRTFDPAAWGGKGPMVWIYDLSQPAPPDQPRLPERIVGRDPGDDEEG